MQQAHKHQGLIQISYHLCTHIAIFATEVGDTFTLITFHQKSGYDGW